MMKEYMHVPSWVNGLVRRLVAGCIVILLACNSYAQKQVQVNQAKEANWINWTIEYKGELSREEKAKLYSAIDSYVKDHLVAQKKMDKGKSLHLNYSESGNTIRVTLDEVSMGSIVGGPHPPPPPIIPNDRLKAINAKLTGISSQKTMAMPNKVAH